MMNHFKEQSYGELLPHNMCFSCNGSLPLSLFELRTMVVPNYYPSITVKIRIQIIKKNDSS